MSVASQLFYSSNDTDKQTLHRRITPSEEQFHQQRDRWNELAEHLIAALKNESGCQIRTWLQGSYKFGTQIRPPRMDEEFDIDLGIFFCWKGQAETGPHDPDVLRNFTQNSLLDFARVAEGVRSVEIPPKPRCGRIRYDGGFHIDIPCYHLDSEADERTLASRDGWEISDPKAIYIWFKNKFDDSIRPRVRRQIRYIKCWAALKWKIGGGRPSSMLLTVLVAEAFGRLAEDEIGADGDTLFALLRQMSARVRRGRNVRNPTNPSEDINRLADDEWSAFSTGLSEFIEVARSACEADNAVAAADHWSKAFAHFFPLPDGASAIAADQMLKSSSLVPAIRPDIAVTAVARNNLNLKFSGRNEIGPIPKNCDIYFEVAEPWNLPAGTTVEWIVRNEGAEAENINDLGHRAGSGFQAQEQSAYIGKHFMDCILRYNGRVFGVRRIPVRISGISAPLRNPVRRPAYARLMGKR